MTAPKQDEVRMLSEAEIAAVDGGSVGEVIDAVAGGIVTAFGAAGAFWVGWYTDRCPATPPAAGTIEAAAALRTLHNGNHL